jgi:hypothetical protein
MDAGRTLLTTGGLLSLAASVAHLAVIFGGPAWYRFFGAGERMARSAERGMIHPTLITIGIASVLAVWAAYAFSGAGLIGRLPLLRLGLVAITAVYVVRAFAYIPLLHFTGQPVGAFAWWSSGIVLVYGLVHVAGLTARWSTLGQ